MMLSGSLLFAYLVGSFCGLAANLSPDVVNFRQDLTDLNKFLAANSIPPTLCYQLREYMHHTVFLRRAATGSRLLSDLAPRLRNQVALTINEKWLQKLDLLQHCEEVRSSSLSLSLSLALSLSLSLSLFSLMQTTHITPHTRPSRSLRPQALQPPRSGICSRC